METINKYHTSKIYKISSLQCDKFYIGSTIETLKKRLSKHKADYKRYIKGNKRYMTSFDIVKFDDAIIQLIKDVKCENRKELDRIEGECILEHHDRILNKCVAGRTLKEYYETNKEKIKQKQKQYCEANKEIIKQKQKQYYETNKEYCEANKEIIKQKQKQYYETNKEIIKQYYETNKEIIKQYREANKEIIKQYYETNKEKINQKFNCECGGKYTNQNKTIHEKTKKHLNFLNPAS